MAGILTVCKKKANCVGFGIELRQFKNNNHAGLCNLNCDHQKSLSLSKEDDIFA